ncbi:hypothetical protein P171DRAFT_427328 [Karstenula rhodostoma CBS 690.94]|uniref:Uncharacterized protein n=1 Tax=Karstenula rhodostoma CBS 690.94 TaxID=1392251 RepID=A0A9P4PYC8_9PLEO|nr:hypothetical protein P171DRAFT_427328 [Karstenula rhodostoma CBS 690.94]
MARKLEMRMETDKGRDGNAAKGSVPDGTVKDAQKTEGKTPQLATKKGLPDFVRNEILEVVRDEFSGAVHINLSERLKSEIAETVKESLLGVLDHKMTEIVKNETRKIISEEGLGGYAPRRKRRRVAEEEDVYESISEERLDTSKFPWPVSYPSQIPTTPMAIQDVITVDAYATKNHYSDLIVGRARLTFCLDPKIRPLVRAKLVPQTFETLRRYNVCMFIPSKYSKVPDRTGELQIPHDQVEFLPAFDGTTRQERSSKMAAALNKYGPQSSEFTIVDTYTGSGFLDWDIIIGHARPEVCADPAARPLVRASLTTDDKVVAYMPARYGSDRNRIDGELGVAIKDVKVWKEFDAPVESKRREMIKEALVRNRNDRLGKVCPGASTERGTEEVRQGGGTEEVDG